MNNNGYSDCLKSGVIKTYYLKCIPKTDELLFKVKPRNDRPHYQQFNKRSKK